MISPRSYQRGPSFRIPFHAITITTPAVDHAALQLACCASADRLRLVLEQRPQPSTATTTAATAADRCTFAATPAMNNATQGHSETRFIPFTQEADEFAVAWLLSFAACGPITTEQLACAMYQLGRIATSSTPDRELRFQSIERRTRWSRKFISNVNQMLQAAGLIELASTAAGRASTFSIGPEFNGELYREHLTRWEGWKDGSLHWPFTSLNLSASGAASRAGKVTAKAVDNERLGLLGAQGGESTETPRGGGSTEAPGGGSTETPPLILLDTQPLEISLDNSLSSAEPPARFPSPASPVSALELYRQKHPHLPVVSRKHSHNSRQPEQPAPAGQELTSSSQKESSLASGLRPAARAAASETAIRCARLPQDPPTPQHTPVEKDQPVVAHSPFPPGSSVFVESPGSSIRMQRTVASVDASLTYLASHSLPPDHVLVWNGWSVSPVHQDHLTPVK